MIAYITIVAVIATALGWPWAVAAAVLMLFIG